MKLSYYPNIDYSRASPYPDQVEQNFNKLTRDMDTALQQEFIKLNTKPRSFDLKQAKLELGLKYSELKKYIQQEERLSSDIKNDLNTNLNVSEKMIEQSLIFKRNRLLNPPQSPIANELDKSGIWVHQVDKRPIVELEKKLKAKYYDKIRAQFHPSNRLNFISLNEKSEEFLDAKNLFHSCGLSKAMDEYFGFKTHICYIALILNREDENWFLPISETDEFSDLHYLHFDADPNVVKTLVYLHDVDVETGGPYNYIKREAFEHNRGFTYFTALANDYVFGPRFKNDTQSRYYRKVFLPENQKYFASLPKAFQNLSHFGDDIRNGTELSKAYLKNNVRISTEVGNIFTFDGSNLLHRGGQVKKGERFALQVAHKPLMNFAEKKEHLVHSMKVSILKTLDYVRN